MKDLFLNKNFLMSSWLLGFLVVSITHIIFKRFLYESFACTSFEGFLFESYARTSFEGFLFESFARTSFEGFLFESFARTNFEGFLFESFACTCFGGFLFESFVCTSFKGLLCKFTNTILMRSRKWTCQYFQALQWGFKFPPFHFIRLCVFRNEWSLLFAFIAFFYSQQSQSIAAVSMLRTSTLISKAFWL